MTQGIPLEAARLVAEEPRGRLREQAAPGEEVVTLHIRRDDAEPRRVCALDDVGERRPDGDREVEERPRGRAHDLRVVRIDGASGEDHRIGAGGVGGADDRAEVPGTSSQIAMSRGDRAKTSFSAVGDWRATATIPCGVTVSAMASSTASVVNTTSRPASRAATRMSLWRSIAVGVAKSSTTLSGR